MHYTYSLNTTSQKLIETEFLNYLTNNPIISLSMKSLQRPINDGGIKFPNPVTYIDLFYIFLFQYFKTRKKNAPFNTETYLIEFEIGLTLSKMYNLPKLNHIPHRDYVTPYYQNTIQIFKEYGNIGVGERGAGGAIALPFVKLNLVASRRKFGQPKIFFGQCLTA